MSDTWLYHYHTLVTGGAALIMAGAAVRFFCASRALLLDNLKQVRGRSITTNGVASCSSRHHLTHSKYHLRLRQRAGKTGLIEASRSWIAFVLTNLFPLS
ncbi:hypothetical protein HNO88_004214 [Novosphingobium chloroacetimidivorans]|uniref:Uncharacterized protein n=1 Tax=Novosphingobium chloroacetimidivorans TaxID=1428314 RepID=A0A7W7KF17_9SPHN|nr:hypothetical protein [Novosphingobium chloroacetimidivorans]